VRTPKYRVEDTADATLEAKEIQTQTRLVATGLSLSFAIYFLLAIVYSINLHMWGTIPFPYLVLFRLWLHGSDELVADCEWQATLGVLEAVKT
jgi:hypothetical protein